MNLAEDTLGEFDISILESDNLMLLPAAIDFKDSALFVLEETDITYDLDTLLAPTWANYETIAPSILSSPSNSLDHSKQLSLASPLMESKVLSTIPPLTEQDDSPLSSPPPGSSCTLATKKSGSRRKTSRNNSIGYDIFSYNYCTNNANTRFKVSKSATTSPVLKPPLKPSVTIASIDTLGRFQKSKSSSSINTTKSTSPVIPNKQAPITHTKRKSVGNPFYKPIMQVISSQKRQSQRENVDSSVALDSNSFIEPIENKSNEEIFVVESLFGNYNKFPGITDNKESYFDPLSDALSI